MKLCFQKTLIFFYRLFPHLIMGLIQLQKYMFLNKNTTNSNSGGTAIAGATNSTYDTGVLSTIGAFYYYIEVTLDGTGCDLATSDVFTVNVVADPIIDTQAMASQEICQNTTLEALEVVVSGNTNTGDFSLSLIHI